jgi:hypothetical protein
VYVEERANVEINSPGEPGILYHIGAGIPAPIDHPFLTRAQSIAQKRIRTMIRKINPYLDRNAITYEEVAERTPSGNVTERHVCEAYYAKARDILTDREYVEFWKVKIGDCPSDSTALQSLIRNKLMKKNGLGYVEPDPESFPTLREMNEFILNAGGIPTLAWLNGLSDGEADASKLLEFAASQGIRAVNIIPDRNYTVGLTDDVKYEKLRDIIDKAVLHGFPIIVGTEMNAPGHKVVDDFDSVKLAPFMPIFTEGAHIIYGHSVLEGRSGMGYFSHWSEKKFKSVYQKNSFFRELGRKLSPHSEACLTGVSDDAEPDEILAMIGL